jgi:hypothetical protein
LEVVVKMLDLAKEASGELAERLIENALEDCVSAFDGFGREVCRVYAEKAAHPAKAEKISFQSLNGAMKNLLSEFGVDLSSSVSSDDWSAAVRGFQKRHLVTHKMGVIDGDYVAKAGDRGAVAGRRVTVSADEVSQLLDIVRGLAQGFVVAVSGGSASAGQEAEE